MDCIFFWNVGLEYGGQLKTREWEQKMGTYNYLRESLGSVQLVTCLKELLQLQFKDQFSSFVWQVSVSWWNLMTSSSLDMSLLISYCVVKTYPMNTGLVEFTHQYMEVLCLT